MTNPPGPHAHPSPYPPYNPAGGPPGYPSAAPPGTPAVPGGAPYTYAPGTPYAQGAENNPQAVPGQPPLAQPAAPGPATPGPGRKSLRAPTILLGAGALVLVAGAVMAILAGAGLATVAGSLSEFRSGYEMEAELEADTDYGLYQGTGSSTSQPQCQVMSPDGEEVAVSSDIGGQVTINENHLFSTFSSDKAGTYTLMCDLEEDGTVSLGLATSVGGVFQGIGGIIAGIFLATVGAAVCLGGLLWLLARRRANRHSMTPSVPAEPAAAAFPAPQAPAASASGSAFAAPPAQEYAAGPGGAPQGPPNQSPYSHLQSQARAGGYGANGYDDPYSGQQPYT